MTTIIRFNLCIFLLCIGFYIRAAEIKAGFFLPDDVAEVTFKFKSIHSLIVLPVVINDSVRVNLILDTGCRNLVLFGKRFQKLLKVQANKSVQFSGLGNGNPINGLLSLNNKVSINTVIGEKIPVVVVPQQNLFATYPNVHGVIGYDIFIKFEIELDPKQLLITFRPAATAQLSPEYEKIPLRIEDSRPIVSSEVFLRGSNGQSCDVMLDTGSSLGLLVKTSDLKKFPKEKTHVVLGKGFNGDVMGLKTTAAKVVLSTFEILAVPAGITYSAWHNYASVGMDVMKDYTVVLNYCQAYAGLKKIL
jgi:hypothetical protein